MYNFFVLGLFYDGHNVLVCHKGNYLFGSMAKGMLAFVRMTTSIVKYDCCLLVGLTLISVWRTLSQYQFQYRGNCLEKDCHIKFSYESFVSNREKLEDKSKS